MVSISLREMIKRCAIISEKKNSKMNIIITLNCLSKPPLSSCSSIYYDLRITVLRRQVKAKIIMESISELLGTVTIKVSKIIS